MLDDIFRKLVNSLIHDDDAALKAELGGESAVVELIQALGKYMDIENIVKTSTMVNDVPLIKNTFSATNQKVMAEDFDKVVHVFTRKEKHISDILVIYLLNNIERKDIEEEYLDAFVRRTMLAVQEDNPKEISELYPWLCDTVIATYQSQDLRKEGTKEFLYDMGRLLSCTQMLNDMIRKHKEADGAKNIQGE